MNTQHQPLPHTSRLTLGLKRVGITLIIVLMVLITVQGATAYMTLDLDFTNTSGNAKVSSETDQNGTAHTFSRPSGSSPPKIRAKYPTYGVSGDGSPHSLYTAYGVSTAATRCWQDQTDQEGLGMDGTAEFTFSVWAYYNNSGSGTQDLRIWGGEGSTHPAFQLKIDKTDLKPILFFGNGDNATCNGVAVEELKGTTALSGAWHMITVVWNASEVNNEIDLFVDGSYDSSASRAGSGTCTREALHAGAGNYTIGSYSTSTLCSHNHAYTGLLDDVQVYNTALTTTQIKNLYDYGNIAGAAGFTNTTNIDWNANNYENSSHQNDGTPQFRINTYLDSGNKPDAIALNTTNMQYYLWTIKNSTIDPNDHWTLQSNASTNNSGNVTVTIPENNPDVSWWIPDCDSWYWYKIQAEKLDDNGNVMSILPQENTTKRRFYYDCINPVDNAGPHTGVKYDNTSIQNKILNETLEIEGVANDTYVFGWHRNITASATGGAPLLWQDTERNLTCADCNYTNSTNISTWAPGLYYLHYRVEDDHTANWIPDYDWETTSNSITYTTPSGTICTIESEEANLKGISTIKLQDRYTWTIETNSAKLEHGYNLICNDKIWKRGQYEAPSYVVGKHWVDFKVLGVQPGEYVVKRLDDNKVNIKLKFNEAQDRIEFDSLGGLNFIENVVQFQITDYIRQAENLTVAQAGETWLNVTWDLFAEANQSELYYNGTLAYNGTATTYNLTILYSHNDYEISVFAHNGTVTNRSKTSANSKNSSTYRPRQPTGVQLEQNVFTWANISWTPGVNASGTIIYNGSDFVANTTASTYNLTGLQAGVGYTFYLYSREQDDKWNMTWINWTNPASISFTGASNTSVDIDFYNLTNTTTAYDTVSVPWQMSWIDDAENESGHTDWTTSASTSSVATSEICDGVTSCYVDVTFNKYNGTDGEQHFEFYHDYTAFGQNLYVIPIQNMSSALTVEVVNEGNNPIEGAIVRVLSEAAFPQSAGSTINAYGLIGQRFTKDEGQAVFYTEIGKAMNIYVTKSGYEAERVQLQQDEWVNDTLKIVLQEGASFDWWEKIVHAPPVHFNKTFTLWINDYKADAGTYQYNSSFQAALTTLARTDGGLFFDALVPGFDYTPGNNLTIWVWYSNGTLFQKLNVTSQALVRTNGTTTAPLQDLQAYAETNNTTYKTMLLALLIVIAIAIGSYIAGESPGFTAIMIGFIPIAFLAPALWIPAVLASVYWIIKLLMRQVEGG